MKFDEKNKRSIVKALTFRAVILCADSVVIFFVTRRLDTTLAVMVLSNITSTILYFMHERAWNKIAWGKRS